MSKTKTTIQVGEAGEQGSRPEPRRKSDVEGSEPAPTQTERQERLRKAAALIEQWMAEPGDYDERVMAFLQESPAATCPDCWANVTGHCPKCGKACASTAVTDFGKNPVIEKAAVFCESQAKYFPDSPMTRNGWLQCAQILRAATTRPACYKCGGYSAIRARVGGRVVCDICWTVSDVVEEK